MKCDLIVKVWYRINKWKLILIMGDVTILSCHLAVFCRSNVVLRALKEAKLLARHLLCKLYLICGKKCWRKSNWIYFPLYCWRQVFESSTMTYNTSFSTNTFNSVHQKTRVWLVKFSAVGIIHTDKNSYLNS